MLDPAPRLSEHFPPATAEQWRELVEKDLGDAGLEALSDTTYDGIRIRPLYHRGDRPEGELLRALPAEAIVHKGDDPRGRRGRVWELRCNQSHPDPDVVRLHIEQDVHGGATSIGLRLDVRALVGERVHPAAPDRGVVVHHVSDLLRCLEGVDLGALPVHLDAGAAYHAAALALSSVWDERGVDPSRARGGFGADPLHALSRDGVLLESVPDSLRALADLAGWTAARCPQVCAVAVDTESYHLAGAGPVDDLAFAMATGRQYLGALVDAGIDVDTAARQIELRMSVGTSFFRSIAKLRAAHRLWARIVEAYGGSEPARALRLHVRLSERVLSRRDPWVNLLRNTVANFAAAIGGAHGTSPVPFDRALGESGELGRRIARNTPLILAEEAHILRVTDPAGGSCFTTSP